MSRTRTVRKARVPSDYFAAYKQMLSGVPATDPIPDCIQCDLSLTDIDWHPLPPPTFESLSERNRLVPRVLQAFDLDGELR